MGNSRIIIPVFFGIILLTSFSASQSAFAHGTVDQSCEERRGGNSSIGFGEPQGQTFVPTADNIVGVDFKLSSARDDGDVIVTIRDGIDGSILGTDTRLGPPRGDSVWIHFDFDEIPLTPGNTYVIQLNEPDFATTPIGGTNFLVDFTGQGCTGDRFFRGVVITGDLLYRTYFVSPNSTPEIGKTLVEGPEQIGIYLPDPTTYTFEISYMGPATQILDTVPAEFDIVSLTPSAGIATSATTSQGIDNSAERIVWDVPAGTNTLIVEIQTVPSQGGGHKDSDGNPVTVHKPTSCGELALNDGSTAFEVNDDGTLRLVEVINPDTGEVTLEPVVIVGPSNSIEVEAVDGAKPCVEIEDEDDDEEVEIEVD